MDSAIAEPANSEQSRAAAAKLEAKREISRGRQLELIDDCEEDENSLFSLLLYF
jgi:hypothetical protein